MALVKTSKVGAGAVAEPSAPRVSTPPPARERLRPAGADRQDKVSERVAAATEELASGLTEAAAAAEELRRAMEQIAAGAEEAAGASQEQLAGINSVMAGLGIARAQAEGSRRRTEAVQIVLAEAAVQITTSVRAIERNAERQGASVEIIRELERRAQDIGEITRTVSRISDQTNLLALNAAIEAARAGEQGRGFAVVAEEVRALAETSEKSAQEVQGLADTIQAEVVGVVTAVQSAVDTAVTEARNGGAVVATLEAARSDMAQVALSADETLTAALEAERAAVEAQKGAEQVAGAAEEQSAATGQAQAAIQQQAQSLDQGQLAAQGLAGLADELRDGAGAAATSEQIGATAEELSATIQELASAATEIMAAVEEINRGSQQQAAATQQTSAALSEIERSAALAQQNAKTAGELVESMDAGLRQSRAALEQLAAGVEAALGETRTSLVTILRLEGVGRRINKVVDAINLVTVQTSMLAVSGSVEAARAGNSGRGFAVVSNDIRSLAREASQSVDSIKDTVQGILDQIAFLRRDLEQVIALSDIEAQNNRALLTVLSKLDEEVAFLGSAQAEILQSTDAMLAATVQTAAGARQIATAAEEASAAARQAATASIQQSRGAEDLAAAVEEIASLADELKQQNG